MTHRRHPSSKSTTWSARYGRTEAVNGLSLRVQPGRCYGFFGRNGAGKTTTIKCLLNLLRPTRRQRCASSASTRRRDEVAVKSRLAYVPDAVAFYPWMTVRDTLDYLASFRPRWNRETEARAARAVPARRAAEDRATCRRARGRSWRSSPRSAPSRSCSCSTSRPRASIRSCAASSSRRSSAPTRTAIPGSRTVFVSTHLICGVRGADRRVHDHREGPRGADARGRRRARALPEDPRALRRRPGRRSISPGRGSSRRRRAARSKSSSTATPPT